MCRVGTCEIAPFHKELGDEIYLFCCVRITELEKEVGAPHHTASAEGMGGTRNGSGRRLYLLNLQQKSKCNSGQYFFFYE